MHIQQNITEITSMEIYGMSFMWSNIVINYKNNLHKLLYFYEKDNIGRQAAAALIQTIMRQHWFLLLNPQIPTPQKLIYCLLSLAVHLAYVFVDDDIIKNNDKSHVITQYHESSFILCDVVSGFPSTRAAWTNWSPFCRRHFQMNFL